MKRLLCIMVLVLGLFLVQDVLAFQVATDLNDNSGDTHDIVAEECYVDFVIVSNSEPTPRYIWIYDSPTFVCPIVVPAYDTVRVKLQCAFANRFAVYCSGNTMAITIGYELGPGGHYPYGLKDDATQDTLYVGAGDLIRVIASNWNSDTGVSVTIEDSGTHIMRVSVPANKTVEVDCDRLRLNSLFQAQLQKTEMGVCVIRRR